MFQGFFTKKFLDGFGTATSCLINGYKIYIYWDNIRRYHKHKKQKVSLETRAVWFIFSLELEISGVAVQGIHQSSKK